MLNPLRLIFPPGRHSRKVWSGLYAGLRLHLDVYGETQVIAGLYEQETFAEIRRLLTGCRTAVDLGAAKGELTVHFLRSPGIERVVAVEPQESERAILASNLALNGSEGDPRLVLHAGFAGGGTGPEWRTLEAILAEGPAPYFVKIDVDGPEVEVLASGREAIRSKDCRFLIETHSPEAETGCEDLLRSLGLATRRIFPAKWRRILPERRDIPHNRWLSAWRA